MTKIKFCGTRDIETVPVINEIMPDYLGFIFSPRFKRYIPVDEAMKIRKALNPQILTVGVFVDEPIEYVIRVMSSGVADIAQLHGSESSDCINRIREVTKKPVIKAFQINCEQSAEAAKNSPADLILLDSGTGSGQKFDWRLIKDIGRDYLLAGGLSPENVAEAIRLVRPFGVDVSSGIETDLKKDPVKMKKFAAQVRGI